jgi:hypothetical protein
MPEDSPSNSRGAHTGGAALTHEQALESNLKFRAEAAKLPGNIAYEQMKEYRARRRRERRLEERGEPEVYGPPNPYRMHRTR